MMSGLRGGSFKSYLYENVPLRKKSPSLKVKSSSENHLVIPDMEHVPKPQLLNGELVIRQAPYVLKFDTFSGQKRGISGSLSCTNFKISFVAANKPAAKTVGLDQRNSIYKENDIPLTFVRTIYQVGERSRKELAPGTKVISNSSKVLEIRTKNCKVFTFSFKFSPASDMKAMIQTILHHAYPAAIQLLFAFSFKHELAVPTENGVNHHLTRRNSNDNVPSIRFDDVDKASAPPTPPPKPGKGQTDWTTGKTPTFRDIKDWQDEMSRWGKQSLRVTSVNVEFMLCDSLPEYFVVPAGLYDSDIQNMAPHFIGSRVPFWCWSSSTGASLFRMSHPNSDMDSEPSIKRVMQSIADIHPHSNGQSKSYPTSVDLDRGCPSVREIQSSFQKLQDLCTVVSMKEFSANESKWLSTLDSCKWLQYVSSCLERASYAAVQLNERNSVVLKESCGRDLSCLVSSLVQIMLDPHYRTQLGFQSLVQREWVAAGHDFLVRSGHCSESSEEVCPVFVLFLDCVFQLLRQFPLAFEFNDTFLIVIWDSLLTCVFDTFLFSSEEHRRSTLELTGHTGLVSVWAWTLQFSQFDQNLFSNPLYLIRDDLDTYRHKLDLPPPVNRSESCNVGVYRVVARSMTAQSGDPAMMNGGGMGSRVSGYSTASSTDSSRDSAETRSSAEGGIGHVLEPRTSAPCIQFWIHCYLRWVPNAHIMGGGEVGIFHQYCCLIGEIQELFKSLETATAREHPPLKSRCHSEKLFLTSFEDLTINQECLTSAFPFTPGDLEFLGADRQSFISTSLVKFLQGQSLLATTELDDQSAEASSDEMDL